MTTLGSDIDSLRQMSRSFLDASSAMRSRRVAVDRVSTAISPRLSASRQRLDNIEILLGHHTASLQRLAQDLQHDADEQERISGRVNRGPITVGFVGGPTGTPLLRGIPRSAVRQGNRGGRVALPGRLRNGGGQGRGAVGSSPWPDFARTTYERAVVAGGFIKAGQALSRSFFRSPNAPRTIKGFLRTDIKDLSKKFALKGVSNATKAKYLKQAKGSSGPAGLGLLAVVLSNRSGFQRFAGEGVNSMLGAVSALGDAKTLVTVNKLGRPLSKTTMTASRIGGAFAIVGGGVGLYDTYTKYKSGQVSGKRAARDGALNGAAVVGGALMLFPATAPVGAVIVAGAAVAQAGAWIYDNRKQIADYAKKANTAVRNAIANPVATARAAVAQTQKVISQVQKVVPAPVNKFVNKVAQGAAKTIGRLFGRKK